MGMSIDDYIQHDALGLAALVRRHEVSPAELVEVAIARIEQLNPALNAVIHPMYDHARGLAQQRLPEGPFTGVPFLLKDLIAAYAGQPMRSGSRMTEGYVPDYDSELVKRYKAAGVITLGKTNTPEYGLMPTTEPEAFGPTCNPWNPSQSAGGSSGGSAAAVAVAMVPMAHGSDAGGSIRIPASCCGVFGFKPTRSRTPLGPLRGDVLHGCFVEHVITRTVRDSAAMLDATQGSDLGAPYFQAPPARPYLQEVGAPTGRLRIAYTARPLMGRTMDPICAAALHKTVKLMQDLGHHVEEAAPTVNREEVGIAFVIAAAADVASEIERYGRLRRRKIRVPECELQTWAMRLLGRTFTATDLNLAIQVMQLAGRRVAQFFESYDVLLTPTLSSPPFALGALRLKPAERVMLNIASALNAGWLLNSLNVVKPIAHNIFDTMPNPILFNITGQPAMSVPLAWTDDGLPIGMQFVSRYADEAVLFRLAGQLEEAQPWLQKLPPMAKLDKAQDRSAEREVQRAAVAPAI